MYHFGTEMQVQQTDLIRETCQMTIGMKMSSSMMTEPVYRRVDIYETTSNKFEKMKLDEQKSKDDQHEQLLPSPVVNIIAQPGDTHATCLANLSFNSENKLLDDDGVACDLCNDVGLIGRCEKCKTQSYTETRTYDNTRKKRRRVIRNKLTAA